METETNPPASIPRSEMTGEQLRAAYEASAESITMTKEHLRYALARWEQSHRDGQTRTYSETQALPVEQVAQESADYLWHLLTGGD